MEQPLVFQSKVKSSGYGSTPRYVSGWVGGGGSNIQRPTRQQLAAQASAPMRSLIITQGLWKAVSLFTLNIKTLKCGL